MKSSTKLKEWREKSEEELKRILQEQKNSLRPLQFALVSGKLKNPKEIKKLKKDIARALTIIKERTKSETKRHA